MQHNWSCERGIYTAVTHYMVAYMHVASKADLFVGGGIYACQNISRNVQCARVYEYPLYVRDSIYATQLAI